MQQSSAAVMSRQNHAVMIRYDPESFVEAPQSTAVDEKGGPGDALETVVDPAKGEGEKGDPGAALETAEGDVHKNPDETSFPEVTEEGYVTRRDQFAVKTVLKGDGRRGGRGRGGRGGRGGWGPTAAKSKASKKECEKVFSSSSQGPIEQGSGLRRMKKHLPKDDEGQSKDEEPEEIEDEKPGSANKPKKKPSTKGKPKAKATAKAKAALPTSKAKPKAKAKAKSKASARRLPLRMEMSRSHQARSPRQRRVPMGKGVIWSQQARSPRLHRKEALEAAFKNTFHQFNQLRKSEPLVFRDMNANAALSNPDHIRAVLKYECTKCLIDCHKAGEADKKGKHDHFEKLFAPDGYRYELYWTRFSVGVKRQDGDEYKQIVYFPRPTTCTGTNRVLARYFVWDLDDLPNCVCDVP